MNPKSANKAAIVLAALLPAVFLGCRSTHSQASTGPSQQPAHNALEVTVPKQMQGRIKVGEPPSEHVARRINAPARIMADETRMARISSPITGRITEIAAVEGQHVHSGQTLAVLHSTELSNTELTFLEACSQRDLSDKAVARAEQLLKADVIGVAELQRRQAELQQKTEEKDAAHSQLIVLGVTPDEIDRIEKSRKVDSVTSIIASTAGVVLERKATAGQVVPPAETVFVIADLSEVWLMADIPEESAGRIQLNKQVEAEVAAFPGEIVRGRLSFVSATVNPETRTVRVRMTLPNPHRKYKPDMLASMFMMDDSRQEKVVPSDAVVREDNRDNVFVESRPGVFLLRAVTLGLDLETRRVLTGGLQTGEKIALNDAFHLNSERKRLALAGAQ